VTDEPWGLDFTPQARRDLRRLDPQITKRVLTAIDRLLSQDASLEVRRITGSSEMRIRVGDWRVRFDFDNEAHVIIVTRVLPRGRAYDR
jgi:mRNA interferase RelE/StbE